MKVQCYWIVVCLAGIVLASCSANPLPGGVRVKTYPVTGIVHVDGEPVEGVGIRFYPQDDSACIKHAVSAGTDDGGRFFVGTYAAGDGLPEGIYKLTFELREEEEQVGTPTTTLARFGQRPIMDRFKGAYADPGKSKYEVTIEKGESGDLGVIELLTTGSGK